MRKDLRKGRVLIDWSQNHVAKTTVAPYSLRARAEPTVSAPVTWDEIEKVVDDGKGERLRFLPADVLERVEELGDLFAPLVT
jgi:bifunctional non-homologous end joining protein LigD